MGEPVDPYREALVVETYTVWPEELGKIDEEKRKRIEQQLHAEPDKAAELEYVRLHTGFGRRITVTRDDLKRCE